MGSLQIPTDLYKAERAGRTVIEAESGGHVEDVLVLWKTERADIS